MKGKVAAFVVLGIVFIAIGVVIIATGISTKNIAYGDFVLGVLFFIYAARERKKSDDDRKR